MKRQMILAERYAQALFELGKDADNVDTLTTQLGQLRSVYTDSKELQDLFINPVYNVDSRKAVLSELADKLQCDAQLKSFLLLLAEKGRGHLLPDVAHAFEELSDKHLGRVHIQVKTAIALSEDFVQQLKDQLQEQTGKEVTLQIEEDADLIGGLTLRMGDQLLDNSLTSRLDQMKERLLRQLNRS